MINTMKSHHPNHSEDICDVDHMLKSAPAVLAAANCPMFVTHPFSVMCDETQQHSEINVYSMFIPTQPKSLQAPSYSA